MPLKISLTQGFTLSYNNIPSGLQGKDIFQQIHTPSHRIWRGYKGSSASKDPESKAEVLTCKAADSVRCRWSDETENSGVTPSVVSYTQIPWKGNARNRNGDAMPAASISQISFTIIIIFRHPSYSIPITVFSGSARKLLSSRTPLLWNNWNRISI